MTGARAVRPIAPSAPRGGRSSSRQKMWVTAGARRVRWISPLPDTHPPCSMASSRPGSHSVTRTRSRVAMPPMRTVASASTPTPARAGDVTTKSEASSIQSSWCSQSVTSSHTISGGPGATWASSIVTARPLENRLT
jgi:hypothetical protein